MKKVIALALALGMALSMTALAADISFAPVVPGDGLGNDFDQLLPGETYEAYSANWGMAGGTTVKDYTMKVEWEKGAALVDSAKLVANADRQLGIKIELKENYTIDEEKDLVGTITMTSKATKTTFGPVQTIAATVTNDVVEVDGASKKDDATSVDVEDNTIYKMTESGWVEFCGDGNRLSSVKVRLPEDKKVFAYFNEDSIDEIEDKYYDLDAEIEYINFVAKPNLGQKADIAIQGDYSDKYYLYEYEGGKLTEIDADWNEDDGLFEFTASKLGSYVISDKALVAEADEEPADEAVEDTTSKNPDTGANDVVGVAVALAAVSLVAAGAVSLKK